MDFFEKAKQKFNDKFDYSKTIYTGWNKEIIVICSEHGEFKTNPQNHLRSKYGSCPGCNPKKQLTTEEFIQKSKEKYGNKYDYSKTIYINSYTKVKIICPIHGEFEQLPNNHLKNCSCKKACKNITFDIDKEKVKNDFINRANLVHNFKYNYSNIEYINNKISVNILCPIHGSFLQRPDMHLKGQGCPVCGINKRIQTQSKTLEEFISQANLIHNFKYDYSNVNYINSKTKVNIICKTCKREFQQTPNKHLLGHGCLYCQGKQRTTEEAINDMKNIYGELYDFSKFEYVNSTTKSLIKCNKHNEWFKENYHSMTTNINRKCCCKEWQSKPNLKIKEILDKHNIVNIPEYTINDCKYINKLKFDFFLPDYNTVIEYQGEWHYFDFKNNLTIQQKRDKTKREYCKNNDIEEIEIPYWNYNKVEEIILEKIFEKK